MFKNIIHKVYAASTGDTEGYYGLKTMGTNLGYQNTSRVLDQESVLEIIGRYISFILSFLGIVVLLFIIFYGVRWMTNRGNSDEIKKIKSALSALIIGLLLILTAYVFSSFILKILIDINK